jgi:hypothetical protein
MSRRRVALALASLIVQHVAAALVHALLWRDRTLARMWRNSLSLDQLCLSEGTPPRPGTPEYDAFRQKQDADTRTGVVVAISQPDKGIGQKQCIEEVARD